ncbi:MAG TPA: nuclear transport factor 2 family protein [Nitrospiraceae bacterium]|nr:nuclear transport factor 2 family protein [Nitrospiraceae bacterium]
MRVPQIMALGLFWLSLGVWAPFQPDVEAKTQLTSGTIQEVDPQTLKELLATFERAEQAMQARDLDGIMALYSEDYLYHGLKKADIRKVWSQLFEHYKELESFHTFSVIRTVGSGSKLTAEITCTGVVWGTSKDTKLRAPVDSWYEEVHYLKMENGRWRIVGNVGGESQPLLQFGVAPHPLF